MNIMQSTRYGLAIVSLMLLTTVCTSNITRAAVPSIYATINGRELANTSTASKTYLTDSTAAPASMPDSVTLSNGEWTVTISNLNSWSGVNNTGNLTYRGCDAQGKCLDLTGGKASARGGQLSYGWRNGEYFYSVSSSITTEERSASSSATLVVRRGDQIILRATGLK